MCNQEDIPIMQPSEQAGISQIVITDEMVRAGAAAYREWEALEGDGSWDTRIMVRMVLERVLKQRASFGSS